MAETLYLIDGTQEVDFITGHQRVGDNQLNLSVNSEGIITMMLWSQEGKKFSIQIGVGRDCILGEFQVMQVHSESVQSGVAVLMGNFVTMQSLLQNPG